MKQWLLHQLRSLLGIPQMQWILSEHIDSILRQQQGDLRRMSIINNILHDTQPGVSSERYTNCDVIVTLTSYGPRLYDVAFAIESIMQQTMRPNRILLWLSHDDCKRIPWALKRQQERGLEIMECDDIKSYKKIIPALSQFPEDVLITIDDDVLYEYDIIEHLFAAYIEHPQYIHCARAHRITLDASQHVLPYSKWTIETSAVGPHRLNFLTGVGGVLYPPHCLAPEVLSEDVFLRMAPFADDVWLNAMAILNGTYISRISTRNPQGKDYLESAAARLSPLHEINVGQHKNDEQLQAVFDYYKLYGKLTES